MPPGPPDAQPARHALVVADGDVPSRAALDAAWPGWAEGAADVIAADGGYARARALGLAPTLLVGDLDSLDPSLVEAAAAAGVPILRSPVAKDESDTELALLEAVGRGAARVTVIGAFGGARLDHELANLWLLGHPALTSVVVALLDATTRASLVIAPGPDGGAVERPLPGRPGSTVSLLPFGGDVDGVTTRGFRYPLRGERLVAGPARGLSNVREEVDASVRVDGGRLLVIETAS
jgi:thiamine pyrophosphokinase